MTATTTNSPPGPAPGRPATRPAFGALGAASLSHFLNDMTQSLFLASYPLFKGGFALSFAQIGFLTLTYQVTASLLQPVIGRYTDRHPLPYSLPFGMAASLAGLLSLAFATNYAMLVIGAVLLGTGSSIFHPESSRIARLASGGAHGLAQSVFQIGGNAGTAVGPLLIAWFVLPHGRHALAWFALTALLGVIVMSWLGRWYSAHLKARPAGRTTAAIPRDPALVRRVMALLIVLIMSKYLYVASISSYYIFYLMHRFGISEHAAQMDLFVFLAGMAVGTMIGGPIGDRIGRKRVIWISILGALPFTLALPYTPLAVTVGLSGVVGVILASAFPAIVVYGQELIPGKVGTVSGLFFGLAFGIGGLGAALLGIVADRIGIDGVYRICAFLPALGLLAVFLPDLDREAQAD
ncbi:MFS transporter [Acidimangrovimonas sediminis]|uniref:MFS transporter n=1 Tax=Acidimangrovimonas sediminis TaxID=2056283 RepID=UPI000C7FFD29|nr:MFS transporter [Acidimangrovimonas sediminis]